MCFEIIYGILSDFDIMNGILCGFRNVCREFWVFDMKAGVSPVFQCFDMLDRIFFGFLGMFDSIFHVFSHFGRDFSGFNRNFSKVLSSCV